MQMTTEFIEINRVRLPSKRKQNEETYINGTNHSVFVIFLGHLLLVIIWIA